MGERHVTLGVPVTSPRIRGAVVFVATLSVVTPARTSKASPRWAVGGEATSLGLPKGHIGLLPSNGGFAITFALVGRYELSSRFAIDAGVGLPHAAMGAAGWATFEVHGIVLGHDGGIQLRLFQEGGPQLGYAGADYFSRHYDSFVGYGYTGAGPLAFALRFPAGGCVTFAPVPIDTYVQIVPIFAFTPRVEPLYDVALGVRVTF